MYRFAKVAVNVAGVAARQVRNGSTAQPDFHAKYGTGLLAGSVVFCTAVWGFVITNTGITWNLSPVGKVTPQAWREKEE
ncbi:hypothetical protein NHX12_009930 [Muraenolepis orangiensis]|uniref:Cytochrome c oxidase subunit 7B, mitochondrial n=1 Tax=Muraenolepis orangiensis TaxID=630683 RepID=A0A9Q0DM44_9TELE|nr:hypothetical protein NHX12_009930 [Muraenolepis orangiensis]